MLFFWCIDLCKHYHNRDTEQLDHIKNLARLSLYLFLVVSSLHADPQQSSSILHRDDFAYLRMSDEYKWDHTVCHLETGFFHSVQCLWDSPKLCVSGVPSSLLLSRNQGVTAPESVNPSTWWRALGWFHCLPITNRVAIAIFIHRFLCGHISSFIWNKYPGVELLAHGVNI